MDRCNGLCTKPATGTCALCDALAARDVFWRRSGFRLLERWASGAYEQLTGPHGYMVFVTLLGAYIGLYAIMEARYERQANRAAFERATFIDLATSGHRGAFVAAIKSFGPVQMITVPQEPSLLRPWHWARTETPNEIVLHQWAVHFLTQCTREQCGHRLGSNRGASTRIGIVKLLPLLTHP